MDPDFALQEDVNALKNLSLDTQALYLRVCHLMFFKYGVMPTTNKLYQFVHKGSMTVVSEVVKLFLAQLREKSRVLVDNGGLPDHVREEAGELLGALWRRALESAEANLAGFKSEAEDKVRIANERAQEAENKATLDRARTAQLTEHVSQLEREKEDLARRLDVAEMASADLQRQLEDQQGKTAEVLAHLEQAKRDIDAEAQRTREQFQAQEAYYKDVERRAMTEVDRQRVENKTLRGQLDSLTDKAQHERVAYEKASSALREQLGKLETLHALTIRERDKLQAEIQQLLARMKEQVVATVPAKFLRKRSPQQASSFPKKLRGNRAS